MRNLMILALIAVSAVVVSQNALEIEVDGVGATSVAASLNKDFGGGLGAFAFLQDCRGWSQFYAGPTWAPCPEIKVGFGLGAEAGSREVRKGGFLWAGKDRLSLLVLFEDGGSDQWYRHRLMYKIDDDWSAGLTKRSGYGEGVVVNRSFGGGDSIRVEGYRSTLTATWRHSF